MFKTCIESQRIVHYFSDCSNLELLFVSLYVVILPMFSVEFITNAVTDDRFARKLGEVASITIKSEREAGFAVYQSRSGDPKLSRVVKKSPRDTHYLPAFEATRAPHTSLNISAIVNEPKSYDPIIPRSDIGILLHSHPGIDRSNKSDGLAPSLPDLDVHEYLSLRSPGIVSGIVVAERNVAVASLLLYREADSTSPKRYQQLTDNVSRETILRTLEESGFAHTVLSFDATTGNMLQPQDEVSEAIGGLYYN